VKLIDLDPHWLIFEGRRVGFIFRCPLPGRREQWQTCFVEKFYMFKSRAGTYSSDDIGFEPDSQCGIVHACAGDYIRDPGNSCNWQSCKADHQWTVEGGIANATFETISVTPSLDGSAGGNWHGHITNGEIVGGV
jgi:hypothetical protein